MTNKTDKTLRLALVLSTLTSLAMADGRIVQMDFCGPDDPNHPDVVQIIIEGGFNVAGCDRDWAAIRVDGKRQHLIEFAKEAFATGRAVKVVLNPNDKYYPAGNAANGRCTISRISAQ